MSFGIEIYIRWIADITYNFMWITFCYFLELVHAIIKRVWPRDYCGGYNLLLLRQQQFCIFRVHWALCFTSLSRFIFAIHIHERARTRTQIYYAHADIRVNARIFTMGPPPSLLCSYLPNYRYSQLPAPFPRFSSSLTKFSPPCQLLKRLKSFRALAKLNAPSSHSFSRF